MADGNISTRQQQEQQHDWNINYGDTSQLDEAQLKALTKAGAKGGIFTDGTSQSDDVGSLGYTHKSNAPVLPLPKSMPRDNNHDGETLDSTPLTNYAKDKNFTAAVYEALENLAPKDKLGKARFAYLNPQADVDASIKALVNKARTMAEQSLGFTEEPTGQSFQIAYDAALQGALAKLQLKYRLNNTELRNLEYAARTGKADHSIKKPLEELQELVKAQFQELNIEIPDDWKPDSSNYLAQLADIGDTHFETSVDEFASKNGLTEEQARLLKTHYYHPDSNMPSKLEGAYKVLLEELQRTMPAGWSPTPDASYYDRLIHGEASHLAGKKVEQYLQSSKLSAEEKQQLLLAFKNPDDPSISGKIRDLASQITLEATGKVRVKYGLSVDTAINVTLPDLNAPGSKHSILNMMDHLEDTLNNYINQLPPGPKRVQLKDFLKMVSDALSSIRESIYRMEEQQANMMNELSKARHETQVHKIEENKKALEAQEAKRKEIEAKQAEADRKGKIMDIVGYVTMAVSAIVTVASFGTLGPVAFAVSAIILALAIADTAWKIAGEKNPTISQWGLGLLGKAFEQIPGLPKEWANVIGKTIMLVAILVLARNAKQTMLIAGSQYFTASNVTNDFALGCGANPMTAAYISMGVGAFVSVSSMIGAASISTKELAKKSKDLAELTSKAEEIAYKASKIARIATDVSNLSTAGMGVYTGVLEYRINNMKADSARAQAALQAFLAEIGAQIEQLKTAMGQLQRLLNTLVSDLSSVGKTQIDTWEKNKTLYASI